VEDAAVAFRRDVPLERELEVLELLRGDDVRRRSHPLEGSLPDSPPRRDRVHLPPPPTGRAVAVKQEAPARGALFRGQDVEPLGGAPRGGLSEGDPRRRDGGHRQCETARKRSPQSCVCHGESPVETMFNTTTRRWNRKFKRRGVRCAGATGLSRACPPLP